jgi:hypothetical protein
LQPGERFATHIPVFGTPPVAVLAYRSFRGEGFYQASCEQYSVAEKRNGVLGAEGWCVEYAAVSGVSLQFKRQEYLWPTF